MMAGPGPSQPVRTVPAASTTYGTTSERAVPTTLQGEWRGGYASGLRPQWESISSKCKRWYVRVPSQDHACPLPSPSVILAISFAPLLDVSSEPMFWGHNILFPLESGNPRRSLLQN